MQKSCFNYPVEFAEDVFGESDVLADTLKKITGSDEPKVLIVADMNVVQRVEGLGSKIGRYVKEHGIRLTWDESLLDYLVKKSYSVTYGARNLRRTIQRELEDGIAERIIDSYEHPISRIKLTADGEKAEIMAL